MAWVMPYMGYIIQAVGAIGSAVSSSKSSGTNAANASAEGKLAIQQSRIEEEQSRRRSAMIMGKQQAQAAAAGLDTTMGTPLDIALDSAQQAELEALNIRYLGKLRKYTANQSAAGYRGQQAGSLFGGAANVGSILSQWWGRGGMGGGASAGGSTGGTP